MIMINNFYFNFPTRHPTTSAKESDSLTGWFLLALWWFWNKKVPKFSVSWFSPTAKDNTDIFVFIGAISKFPIY